MKREGQISVNSKNMFPIIKKWLYSDKDIFLREIVSNSCDAIKKLISLRGIGQAPQEDGYQPRVEVRIDSEKKQLIVSDNGIGMTEDEVERYITQVAFSGAEEFLQKYGEDASEAAGIIGHFGLGFYSSFMVSDTVEIQTLSFQPDAKPVHWTSSGEDSYEIEDGERTEHGTTIIMNITEGEEEFLQESRIREILNKYCQFMPYEIYLNPHDEQRPVYDKDGNMEKNEDGTDKMRTVKPLPVNDTQPLWLKSPSECTDEEYKAFYQKVFMDFNEPLFWIHLNVDYPFNLKGILYFPKQVNRLEVVPGQVKLYSNQVFVADNIKEVIPEFLLLLKGVIDCPDMPLNVSRSFLQNDGQVQKIAQHITKKVSDKLHQIFKNDRETYEKYWNDISAFIKFGCLKDDKFCEKMNDYILFKNLDGKYLTLPECLEIKPQDEEENKENAVDENGNKVEAEVVGDKSEDEASGENTEEEKKEKIIYYVTDEQQQSQYINMFKAAKMDAVILTHNIDQPFISQLEQKNEGIKFQRIDADVTDALKSKTSKKAEKEMEEQAESISKLMKKALKNDKITVKVEKLKNKKISSMITLSEESRRMQDMMKMYSMPGMDMSAFGGEGETLILNANHPLVQYITEHQDGENAEMICEQLYDLAKLQHAPLSADAMTKFVARSNDIMMLLTK